MHQLQKEFDKHPIKVPINVDEPDLPTGYAVPGHTMINYGPVIHGGADGASWPGTTAVPSTRRRTPTSSRSLGFELVAQALISTREDCPALALPTRT